MLYKDRDGTEYRYAPTQSSVMRAEDRAGLSLLGALADAQNAGGTEADKSVRLANTLASIKVAASLLYEALPIRDRNDFTFDAFVDRFEPGPFTALIAEVVALTMNRFSDETAPAGGGGSGPKEHTVEAKSTESSPSPV